MAKLKERQIIKEIGMDLYFSREEPAIEIIECSQKNQLM